MPNDRFLITGALGCIGAWTVRNLVREEPRLSSSTWRAIHAA
jgi:nucleoside-diphosphate-sugar epimerase